MTLNELISKARALENYGGPMQTGATVEPKQIPIAPGQIRQEPNGSRYEVIGPVPGTGRWTVEWQAESYLAFQKRGYVESSLLPDRVVNVLVPLTADERRAREAACAIPQTGDRNLQTPPKPDFHGVRLGEWRKTKQGWGEVVGMDAGTKTCRLRFPGNLGHLDEHYDLQWISKQGVSNLPPASAVRRCRTGTACKSPADAPLGYLGLCWPCAVDREVKTRSMTDERDGRTSHQRAQNAEAIAWWENLLAQTYDNSRSAGIGVAGTIWRLRP